jgi:hypothetical protein
MRRYAELARTEAGFAGYSDEVIGASESRYREAEDLEARLGALAAGPVG